MMRSPQIQEVLSALGVQMDEVAHMVGWSYDDLIEYATTSKDVPEEVLLTLAKALGITTEIFFDDRYLTLIK